MEMYVEILHRIAALGAVLMLAAGCTPGVGVRCNPALFEDECGSNAACTIPPSCVVAVCCPRVITSTSGPACQPCATDDAGSTGHAGAADAAGGS
jgi:hypothetical protein